MSAVLTQTVRAKLAPLIRLLSSPVDGERLAAVGGLGRVLRGAGLTFHELAHAIERPQEVAAPRAQASSEPRRAKPRRPARADAPQGVALSPARRRVLLVSFRLLVRDASATLTAWEFEFAEAILRNLEGERPCLSVKQLEVAERIINREQGWRS